MKFLRLILLLCLSLPMAGQVINWPKPPYPPTNVSFSGTSATLISAPSSGAICVYGLLLVNAGGSNTTINIFQDGGSVSVASAFLVANGGSTSYVLTTNPLAPYFITNTKTAFVVTSSNGTQINGTVYSAGCP